MSLLAHPLSPFHQLMETNNHFSFRKLTVNTGVHPVSRRKIIFKEAKSVSSPSGLVAMRDVRVKSPSPVPMFTYLSSSTSRSSLTVSPIQDKSFHGNSTDFDTQAITPVDFRHSWPSGTNLTQDSLDSFPRIKHPINSDDSLLHNGSSDDLYRDSTHSSLMTAANSSFHTYSEGSTPSNSSARIAWVSPPLRQDRRHSLGIRLSPIQSGSIDSESPQPNSSTSSSSKLPARRHSTGALSPVCDNSSRIKGPLADQSESAFF